MKLNQKYDHPKSIILMMNPLPTISKAYGFLLQEEQHKEVQYIKIHDQESTIFTVRKFDENKTYKPYYNFGSGSQSVCHSRNFTYNRNNLFCEHCKMKNHTVDKCWKLHGYPKDFKGKRKRVAAATQTEDYTEKGNQNDTDAYMVHATFIEEKYNQLFS